MDKPKEFQILVRRKIPYISEGLWSIVAALFLIMLLLYLFMLPTKNAPDEMSTAYYILVVPEWLKKLSSFAFVGLIIFIPLYFAARLNKPAILTLSDDTIFIKGKKLDLAIPFKNIKRIYFNDLMNFLRQPKNKMQIVIQQKSNKSTVFLLANYDEADNALDTFSKVNNAEFAFYDDNIVTLHDDE
jgi:hypothetical protein